MARIDRPLDSPGRVRKAVTLGLLLLVWGVLATAGVAHAVMWALTLLP